MKNLVSNKKDFVRRYKKGEFGNASPTWDSLNDFLLSDYVGLLHIRNQIKGGTTWYNVPSESIEYAWSVATSKVRASHLYISAMAPTWSTKLQGETQRTAKGLYLRYSTVCKPMREALEAKQGHSWGLTAKLLLESYMDPQSLRWLWHLLGYYDDHVVEFSTYGVNWGTVPNRNTVFWEVRKY